MTAAAEKRSLMSRMFGRTQHSNDNRQQLARAMAAADDGAAVITYEPPPVDIGTLENEIVRASNDVVHLQGELDRALRRLDDLQRSFEDAIVTRRLVRDRTAAMMRPRQSSPGA